MVSVHTLERDWIEKIKVYTNDATLQSMIGKPEIPAYFVKVLHVMLSSCQLSPSRELHYGVATTILQMGLEVHDRIPTFSDPLSLPMISRQLLVLSGDYYSSQYYRLMTKHQEIDGLAYLSTVICTMNESRVNLHSISLEEKPFSVDAYPDLPHFTSGLLAALADFFHVEQYLAIDWKRILSPLLLLHFINQRAEWLTLLSESLCAHIIEQWCEGKKCLSNCPDFKVKQRIIELYVQSEPWIKSQLLVKES